MLHFAKRRCRAQYLKDIDVREVSIVADPANLRPFLMLKSMLSGVEVQFTPLAKAKGEKMIAYGIVYEPDVADGQDEAANCEEIEKAAHGYMVKSQTVGVDHDREAPATVVESFIAPQEMTMGGEKVRKGSWIMAVRVNDPALWESIKKGERTGFSMGGTARDDNGDEQAKAASALFAGGKFSKSGVSGLYEMLSSCRTTIDAIGTMLGATVPDYSVPEPQSMVDIDKARAAVASMAAWLTDVASSFATLVQAKATMAKSLENSDMQIRKENEQVPGVKLPEDLKALQATVDAQAAKIAALEATAKADAEAKVKADEDAFMSDVENWKKDTLARVEQRAGELAEKVVAAAVSEAQKVPVDTLDADERMDMTDEELDDHDGEADDDAEEVSTGSPARSKEDDDDGDGEADD